MTPLGGFCRWRRGGFSMGKWDAEWLRDIAAAEEELKRAKTKSKINEIQMRIKGMKSYIRMDNLERTS